MKSNASFSCLKSNSIAWLAHQLIGIDNGGAALTPKERVLTTLNHDEPDKIPYDSWMAPEVADVMVQLLGWI